MFFYFISICCFVSFPAFGEHQKILKAYPIKNFKVIQIKMDRGNVYGVQNPKSPFTQILYTKKDFEEEKCTLTMENKNGKQLLITVKKQEDTAKCAVDFELSFPNTPSVLINGKPFSFENKKPFLGLKEGKRMQGEVVGEGEIKDLVVHKREDHLQEVELEKPIETLGTSKPVSPDVSVVLEILQPALSTPQ